VVQGAGGVGGRLIELLRQAGADVTATDIDSQRLELLRRGGVKVVPPEAALTTECDVLAPCATGGIINARTIPALRCRVVAGGANNQLEQPADADMLAARGIVYAPDFVINAGGVLHGGGLELLGWSRATLDDRLAGIGAAVFEILQRAARDGISSDTAARQIAQSRLEAATPSRVSAP
jgi:leucine dehydrogenase